MKGRRCMETQTEINTLLRAALWECGPATVTRTLEDSPLLRWVTGQVEEDAQAYAGKDPACHGSVATVLRGYTSFRAVLHYRLAHALTELARASNSTGASTEDLQTLALLLSSRGKLLSGIEIHPHCRIGRRLVIDHGLGTVVGETVDIGDDAYLLGGVTLGATGIATNPDGKRHPTLGHRVQVGAFAGIYGPVCIGDDVFIGAGCRVTQPVPAGARVTLRCSMQVEQRATSDQTTDAGSDTASGTRATTSNLAERAWGAHR